MDVARGGAWRGSKHQRPIKILDRVGLSSYNHEMCCASSRVFDMEETLNMHSAFHR